MYYPCSENKDADQLRDYREADLRLCFRPCKLLVFSRTGSTHFCILNQFWCIDIMSEFSTDFGYFSIYEQLKFHAQLS